MTSSDNGVTWALQSTPSVPHVSMLTWTSVAYGGGAFVSVAGDFDAWTSDTSISPVMMSFDNAATWSLMPSSSAVPSGWAGVAYGGNGAFIAVSGGVPGRSMYYTGPPESVMVMRVGPGPPAPPSPPLPSPPFPSPPLSGWFWPHL